MNVLFLTIGRVGDINEHAIYPDLLRQFLNAGHRVCSVSTYERRLNIRTEFKENNNYASLHVRTGNLTGCSIIEKGVSTLMIDKQYRKAVDKYLSNEHFDLILYSTPPITLNSVAAYLKKKHNAVTYLLLKDIFPQNAVDLGILRPSGSRAALYRRFRREEKKLYRISDRIGCMSEANIKYLLSHNPEIPPQKVELSPNCIEPRDISLSNEEKIAVRKKYGLPTDKKIFVYGGNLGKPQGIPFLIDCIRAAEKIDGAFFLVVGSGTEYEKLSAYQKNEEPKHFMLLSKLPKDEYDSMLAACDIGLIFLDHRFTIPNFPSRLLPYLQAKMPVIACTDPNSDIGQTAEEGGFGWRCESDSTEAFCALVEKAVSADLAQMGENAYRCLEEKFSAQKQYLNIMRSISGGKD